jgi:geranylgeranyl diphosphate synthase type II
VHTHYGVNSGILSGDAMLILVYEELLKIKDVKKRFKVLSLFTQTAKEVCEGQQYDIDFETREDVSIEDYLLMIKLKTAVLLACSLQVGAILGGASDDDAQNLYDFGLNIGISFQVQDDLLDTYGEQARVGKMIGGDIQQKKKTILYLTTLQHAESESKNFKQLYNSDLDIDEKLPLVKAMMDNCQIQEKMNALKKQYLDIALESLGRVHTQNKKGLEELEELANFIVNRVK